MARFNSLWKLLCIASLLLLTIGANAQTAVSSYGQLSVSGTKVVSSTGKPVQLQGMSLFWSTQSWGQDKYFNKNTIEWLRDDWCINIIRATMAVDVDGQGYMHNKNGELAKIETVIEAAIELGIYVIVDFHSHHASDNDEKALAIEFFDHISKKYGSYPNIIYETFNEPLQVSWSNVVKPYHETIINTIRANDANNIIVVGTPSWDQDVDIAANDPITGEINIAYTLHYYAASHGSSYRSKAQTAISKGLCLFVTEYGICEANGNGYINENEANNWWTFLDNNDISHCNWSISDKNEKASALQANASTNGNWNANDLRESGTIVRAYLKDNCPDYGTPGTDCNGDLNGTAIIDNCGTCAGGLTGVTPNSTCEGGCTPGLGSTGSFDDFTLEKAPYHLNGGVFAWGEETLAGDNNPDFQAILNRNFAQTKLEVSITQGQNQYVPIGFSTGDKLNGDVASMNLTGNKTLEIDINNTSNYDLKFAFSIQDVNGNVVNTYPTAIGEDFGDAYLHGIEALINAGRSSSLTLDFTGAVFANYISKTFTSTFDFTKVSNVMVTVTNQENTGSPNWHSLPLSEATIEITHYKIGECDDATNINLDIDCNGDLGGTAFVDSCKICAGGDTDIKPSFDKNTCSPSNFDCFNVEDGTASFDDCGVCSGGTTGKVPNATCEQDCNGDWDGTAKIDNCDVCSGGETGITPNSSCVIDCNGDADGTAEIDACNVCAGGETGIIPGETCGACKPGLGSTGAFDDFTLENVPYHLDGGVFAWGEETLSGDNNPDFQAILNRNSAQSKLEVSITQGQNQYVPFGFSTGEKRDGGKATMDLSGDKTFEIDINNNSTYDLKFAFSIEDINGNVVNTYPTATSDLFKNAYLYGIEALINAGRSSSLTFDFDKAVYADYVSTSFVSTFDFTKVSNVMVTVTNQESTGSPNWHSLPISDAQIDVTHFKIGVCGDAKNINNIEDCNGDIGGTAYLDQCETCVGGDTGLDPSANCETDCNGVTGGTASIDNCEICSGGNTGIAPNSSCEKDCNGDWDGNASLDDCDVCSGGKTGITPNSTCTQDCNGDWDGTASYDQCNTCSGGNTGITPNSTCNKDCNGDINGTASLDDCDVCAGGQTGVTPNSSCQQDCNGDYNGSASYDQCGVCSGGNTGIKKNETCELDCNGDWNGSASFDDCEVCSGGQTGISPNSSCVKDCNGDWNGTASLDNCDVCAGGKTGITPNDCILSNDSYSLEAQTMIFPNPTTGNIEIQSTSDNSNWTIYNAQGMFIISGNGNTADLSEFSNGLYLIEIDNQLIKINKQ